MKNKSDIKGIFLIVFIVISILLAGFVVYDKLLKKETCNCSQNDCQCEKCSKNDDFNNDNKLTFASKYVNENDKNSYISFDTTKNSWYSIRNVCEGYEELRGSYTIENNKIKLLSDSFTDDKSSNSGANVVFALVSNDSGYVEKIYDLVVGDFSFAGCMGSDYFVAEK